jgi:tetratricopeptide (TPR) repeat protein
MRGQTDAYGHDLGTDNATAAAAFDRAVHAFALLRTETMAELDTAIASDPDFVLAKLAKAWILHSGRSSAFTPVIDGLFADVGPRLNGADGRSRAYYDGLRKAQAGDAIEAGTIMESVIAGYPTDLLAHRLTQLELFWNGRIAWMRDIADRAADRWNDDLTDYGTYLAVRAFAAEEDGDYATAERCGRQAIERNPADCWAAHAVVHALTMQGRIDEGVEWVEDLSGHWTESNQMKHHLWWHACVLLQERGEHDRILDLLTSHVRNPDSPLVKAAPAAPIDIQNLASMLMRLRLGGVDVGNRWSVLADACAGRIHDHRSPFGNAHDMMVLAATEQFAAADELINSMRAFAAEGDGSLALTYRTVGIAICEAVLAHFKGDFERVLARLSPARHDLSLVGGSHVQRDLFYWILVDAARHQGRPELVTSFIGDVGRTGITNVAERAFYRDA